MTSAQLRMARAALNWTVRDLAEKSRVHRNTISRLESDPQAHAEPRTLAALAAALEAGGVVFVGDGEASLGDGPGVRLKQSIAASSSD